MSATIVRSGRRLRVALVFVAMLVVAAAAIPVAGATVLAARFLVIGAIPLAGLTVLTSRRARARLTVGEGEL